MNRHRSIAAQWRAACLTAVLFLSAPALAFPPYRSTDADTADPYALELRLGSELAVEDGESEILVPRLRANFGLPGKIEFISELEYLPEAHELADGALGLKVVPWVFDRASIGIEALALLPVNPSMHGLGAEIQALASLKTGPGVLHLNAGGSRDGRAGGVARAWRASGLYEVRLDHLRIGVELFAKDSNRRATDARAGAGAIYDLGAFDLRTGVHAGLTRAAPDVSFNLWIATKFSFL